jgi:hypothetical protein
LARRCRGPAPRTWAVKAYHPTRYGPKVESCANDPAALVAYARYLVHSPPTDGYSALVKANRLDLAVESLVSAETKVYAPVFSDEDRAAACARLAEQREKVAELQRDRERARGEEDDRVVNQMNERRRAVDKPPLTTEQEASVRENRRQGRALGGR